MMRKIPTPAPIHTYPALRAWFLNRRVLVVGAGMSGVAAARLLARLGARVTVSDRGSANDLGPGASRLGRSVTLETGGHRAFGRCWDLVIMSPGIPLKGVAPRLKGGPPVWGELELGYRVLKAVDRWPPWTAAVTGTNGKTTTTSLLGEMFRLCGRPTVVAGNIGTPLCAVVDAITHHTALALEVSSYQLETVAAFRPAVGVVLNVTPDHLGRHGTMDQYARAKERLFWAQGNSDTAVLNAADPYCRRMAPRAGGRVVWFNHASSRDGLRWDGRRMAGAAGRWPAPKHLLGRHNVDNAMAAALCARALGAPVSAVARAFQQFRGVPHRLEVVRLWRGARFINDSKATNVDATRVALEAVPGPVRVILGGQDKGAPYTPLIPLLKRKAVEVVLIGSAAEKIRRDLNGVVPLTPAGDMAGAVARLAQTARPGEDVLLSPACASFDQFDNFEHRGRVFAALVNAL